MVCGNQHDSGQLAVSSRHRLHRSLRKAENLAQHTLRFINHRQSPLRQHAAVTELGQKRMQFGKTGHPHDLLMGFRIVFHRAGTERIKIRIHAHVHAAEIRKMAHRFKFGHFGKPCGFSPPERRRHRASLGNIQNGKDGTGAAGPAGFINQFHSNASIAFARALISSFVRFSVTAISIWSRLSA